MGNEIGRPACFIAESNLPSEADTLSAERVEFNATAPPLVDQTTIYKVRAGETPSGLALKFYGRTEDWKLVFDANRDQLTDPERIVPGQMLKIPLKP